MEIALRSELLSDFNKISLVIREAFEIDFLNGNVPALHVSEVTWVDYLRHSEHYDNDLAIVALVNNEIVGHIMYTPCNMRFYGIEVKAVALSIVSVRPSFQKCGIGKKLIEEGLKISREKGYQLSFVLGHPSYYPRFGYIINGFGESSIVIKSEFFQCIPNNIKEVAVQDHHMDQLVSMHYKTYEGVNVYGSPSRQIIEWKSISPHLKTSVLEEEDIKGYIRYVKHDNVIEVKKIVSNNNQDLVKCISYIFQQNPNIKELKLPINPQSSILDGLEYSKVCQKWEASMLFKIDPKFSSFDKYMDDIQTNEEQLGAFLWPMCLDLL